MHMLEAMYHRLTGVWNLFPVLGKIFFHRDWVLSYRRNTQSNVAACSHQLRRCRVANSFRRVRYPKLRLGRSSLYSFRHAAIFPRTSNRF
jgi:hypothetical protein